MVRLEHSGRVGSRAILTFVLPVERKKITYREQQARLRRAIISAANSNSGGKSRANGGAGAAKRSSVISGGSLLDTLEKGGEAHSLGCFYYFL